jgi:hypothetical protein
MVTLQCQAMDEDAFGPIFLDLEGTAFPEDGWEDFAGLMLFEWLASSVRWLQDETEETGAPCIYRFMDGPYEFHATRIGPSESQEPQELILTFHERMAGGSTREMEVAPVRVEQGAFLRLLLDAASKIQWERGRSEIDDMMRTLSKHAAERDV